MAGQEKRLRNPSYYLGFGSLIVSLSCAHVLLLLT